MGAITEEEFHEIKNKRNKETEYLLLINNPRIISLILVMPLGILL